MKWMQVLTLLLAVFTTRAFAQTQNYFYILDELRKSSSAGEKMLDQMDKKISCYHIGRIQALSSVLNKLLIIDKNAITSKTYKRLKKLDKKVSKLGLFCNNKTQKIGIQTLVTNLRLDGTKRLTRKISEGLDSNELLYALIPIDFEDNLSNLVSSSRALPTQFGVAVVDSELEVDANKYKPSSCYIVGQVYTYFELMKNNSDGIQINNMFKVGDLATDLRDFCFNNRGFSQYHRNVNEINDVLKPLINKFL